MTKREITKPSYMITSHDIRITRIIEILYSCDDEIELQKCFNVISTKNLFEIYNILKSCEVVLTLVDSIEFELWGRGFDISKGEYF